ncbi:hypothetical protein [Cytobacillus kochii]|uniref:hypothetical protein n=1 Tax=Cytobacillus kochii TaxID=859143 RepID=UPI00203EB562|nr:hypothetical protein [Cytobacillus kochii]MCM3321909.1 hypothetical protein [Cytobacillus kochii]MCM3343257.1 hypothetical protein [Cytobacillus kochii]
MKNFLKWLTVPLAIFLLAACGTSETDNGNGENNNSNPPNEEVDEDEDENQNENKDDSQKKENEIRVMEENLSYEINGETKEETAFLKESDNQAFSLHVLPDFTLTAEEPNKDILHLNDQSEVFMRIEVLPEEVDMKQLEENTMIQLQSVNEEVEHPSLPQDDFFKDAVMMEASSETDTVTAFIVHNDSAQVKLTLFNKNEDTNYKDAFIEMAKTIQTK